MIDVLDELRLADDVDDELLGRLLSRCAVEEDEELLDLLDAVDGLLAFDAAVDEVWPPPLMLLLLLLEMRRNDELDELLPRLIAAEDDVLVLPGADWDMEDDDELLERRVVAADGPLDLPTAVDELLLPKRGDDVRALLVLLLLLL